MSGQEDDYGDPCQARRALSRQRIPTDKPRRQCAPPQKPAKDEDKTLLCDMHQTVCVFFAKLQLMVLGATTTAATTTTITSTTTTITSTTTTTTTSSTITNTIVEVAAVVSIGAIVW